MIRLQEIIGENGFNDILFKWIKKTNPSVNGAGDKEILAKGTKDFVKLCKKSKISNNSETNKIMDFINQFIKGTHFPRLNLRFIQHD
eukprot:jgi/Bigna1/140784/aug1.58_g15492